MSGMAKGGRSQQVSATAQNFRPCEHQCPGLGRQVQLSDAALFLGSNKWQHKYGSLISLSCLFS